MLGTFDSGIHGESISNPHSIFFSASTTRTLRTNGLVNDPMSFMASWEWEGK